MKVRNSVNGQGGVDPIPAIEWRVIYSKGMGGPLLQGRNPGREWQNVLAITDEGLLDPSYGPDLDGLEYNTKGYVECVSCYKENDR